MPGCRKFLIPLIYLSVIGLALPCFAQEEIEDLIDVVETKNKVMAVIQGKKTVSVSLRPGEKVQWSGSRGDLGAVLTNRHFFVVSSTSDAWQAWPLNLEESRETTALLSPYMALLVTRDRALAFDSKTGRFVEARLPLGEELAAAKLANNIALVITSNQVFALSAESSAFREISLRVKETIESAKLTANKATVLTSHRLLTFEATDSTWREHRLD